MLSLDTMPSITFQIDLHEPVFDIDRTTFSPGTILSSYTEQSRTTFTQSKGRLSAILATPHKFLETNENELLNIILKDAQRLKLNLNARQVKEYRKVTWAHDFYTYERGSDKLRPNQATPINGLFLAGDYTKQKFLSTMEGAVYSGELAANFILELDS